MNFLGIDVGTGGSRAILIDESGAVLACETAEHPAFDSPEIGWAEQPPDDWWAASVEVIGRIVKKAGADAITAIGLSGQMHGSVLLDDTDRPLRPALLWCDQRTAKQCREITETIGPEDLIELVSNPAITGFTLPKLLWVRENEPEIWKGVRSILLPKDYVRLRLSGDKASDVADASGTLLFDVRNRNWSHEMLETFGIDRELLPEIFESVEAAGRVSAKAAADTGLKAGTLIVAGAGDNAAGAVGMGVTLPGTVSVTIGTSGVVFGVTEQPRLDLKGRIHTLCHAIPERWHNTGVTLAAGLSFKWFRENFGCGLSFDQLADEAEEIPSGSEGVIFLPYLMGERTPHLDPDARGAFIGLTAGHTRSHLTRAVMEGVAFSLRESLEIFKELGAPVVKIRLGGGGAKSSLWRQVQADVYGSPVEILSSEEGAAFGAAILAGVGSGAWASVDEACEAAIHVSEIVEPDPESVEMLDRSYQAYTQLYSALRPVLSIIKDRSQEQ